MTEKKSEQTQREIRDKELDKVSGGVERLEGPKDDDRKDMIQPPTKIDHRIG